MRWFQTRRSRALAVLAACLTGILGACGDAEPAPNATPAETKPAADPTTTEPTARASGSDQDPESVPADVSDTVSEIEAAIEDGDVERLLDLTHPAVIDQHGREVCQRHLAEVAAAADFEAEVVSAEGPATVTVPMGLQELDVPDAWRLEVAYRTAGHDGRTELIVADRAGDLHWLPSCARFSPDTAQAIARVDGDGRSAPFDVTSPWRVEARTEGPCRVVLHDAGGSAEPEVLAETPWPIVVHLREAGTFELEVHGCSSVRVFAASAEAGAAS